jgi:hypothetical protein
MFMVMEFGVLNGVPPSLTLKVFDVQKNNKHDCMTNIICTKKIIEILVDDGWWIGFRGATFECHKFSFCHDDLNRCARGS